MKSEFVSVERAAAWAGRSASTIWRWIKSGELPAFEVAGRTRIRSADLRSMFQPERLGADEEDDDVEGAGDDDLDEGEEDDDDDDDEDDDDEDEADR